MGFLVALRLQRVLRKVFLMNNLMAGMWHSLQLSMQTPGFYLPAVSVVKATLVAQHRALLVTVV
jgi:hypothetical protein